MANKPVHYVHMTWLSVFGPSPALCSAHSPRTTSKTDNYKSEIKQADRSQLFWLIEIRTDIMESLVNQQERDRENRTLPCEFCDIYGPSKAVMKKGAMASLSSKTYACCLNPVPTSVIKSNTDSFLPVVSENVR